MAATSPAISATVTTRRSSSSSFHGPPARPATDQVGATRRRRLVTYKRPAPARTAAPPLSRIHVAAELPVLARFEDVVFVRPDGPAGVSPRWLEATPVLGGGASGG